MKVLVTFTAMLSVFVATKAAFTWIEFYQEHRDWKRLIESQEISPWTAPTDAA